jgi:hypothetical protein
VTVTDVLADLVLSAWLVAVMLTLAGFGTILGAAYKPAGEIVPTASFPPAMPFTPHVTDWLLLPVTAAVNCCVAPTARVFAEGEIVT